MRLALAVSLLSVLSAHAAPPVPDLRIEQIYNTQVVPNIRRSVDFERTLPQPTERKKPVVNEQDVKQVADGVYVDRAMLPRGPEDEPGVIRVFPSSSSGASAPARTR